MGRSTSISQVVNAAGENLENVLKDVKLATGSNFGDNIGGTATIHGRGNTMYSGLDNNETDILFRLIDSMDKANGVSSVVQTSSAAVQAAARKVESVTAAAALKTGRSMESMKLIGAGAGVLLTGAAIYKLTVPDRRKKGK